MQDKREVVLIGYSGHGYVVCDTLSMIGMPVDSYCDLNKANSNPFDLNFLGSEMSNNFDWKIERIFVLGIGDNYVRTKVGNMIVSKGRELQTVIHPKSIVSEHASIGKGVFINAGAVVNSFCEIGDMSIINSSSVVEHNCQLAKGVHIAPGAVLLGSVHVGENSFIGANSVVRQGINIGRDCVIGAGSVVVKDIKDGCTVFGNPAK